MSQINDSWQIIQRRVNVILFGEIDAGKTSLINLISGLDHDIAKASFGASGRALDARPYDVTIQGRDFRIFETVGWDEPHLFRDPDFLINSISKAYRLVKYLSDTGGINLLVFCIRKDRITVGMHNNYMLFNDFLCHKQVPIVLVITHLEHEKSMEDWWLDHHTHFAAFGMDLVDHACITAKRQFVNRYQASRQIVRDLLVAHSCEIGFTQERVSWVTELFEKSLDFLGFRPRFDSLRGRTQKLREHGLREDEITALLRKISAVDEDMPLVRPPKRIRLLLRGRRNALLSDVAVTRHPASTSVDENCIPSTNITPYLATSVSHDEALNLDQERRSPDDLTSQVNRESHNPVASGAFADIYRGMLQSHAKFFKVAIKAIRTYSSEDSDCSRKENRLRREVRVWQSLEHENVLPLLGTIIGFSQLPAMVCPWAENGTLTSYLKERHTDLSVVDILRLLDNVASGLQYLHSCSIVHGDLSGSNILINEHGCAWIADFGLSTLLTELGESTFATSFHGRGTIRWMAPESLDLSLSENEVEEAALSISPTTHSDVYSFGSIMLQILSGKVPYHYYKHETQVLHALSKGMTPRRPCDALVTGCRWTFIQRCWSTVDTTQTRPTSDEIVDFTKDELACVSTS